MSVVLSLVTKFNLKMLLIRCVVHWIILNILKIYKSGKYKDVWRITGTLLFINIEYEHELTANSMENSIWEIDNCSVGQQIPCTLRYIKFHYRAHKAHIFGSYLNQISSVHFNIFLPLTPGTVLWLLTICLIYLYHLPCAALPSFLLDLVTLVTYGEEYKLWSSLFSSFIILRCSSTWHIHAYILVNTTLCRLR